MRFTLTNERFAFRKPQKSVRIALIGDFGSRPDEAMKKLCAQSECAVRQHHEAMTVQTSDFCKGRAWDALRRFRPRCLHYLTGPTIFNLMALKFHQLTLPGRAVTVATGLRPYLGRMGRMLLPWVALDADFVYGDTEVILEDGTILQSRPETSFHPLILRYGANVFSQPACFFRRRTGEKLGWLDPNLHWSMDYEFWLRAAASGAAFKQIKKLVARFRLHQLSKTGSNHAKTRREHYECYRRHTRNVLLRPKPIYRALKVCYRSLRVLRLYFERGVWQPEQYSRTLRRLNMAR